MRADGGAACDLFITLVHVTGGKPTLGKRGSKPVPEFAAVREPKGFRKRATWPVEQRRIVFCGWP
jgi:hypothetical protein